MHRLTVTMQKELHFHKLLPTLHSFTFLSYSLLQCEWISEDSIFTQGLQLGPFLAVGLQWAGYTVQLQSQWVPPVHCTLLVQPGKHLQLTHYLVHWCMYSCKKSCQAVTRHPIRQLICVRSPSRNTQQGPHACKRDLCVCARVLITTCGATCCREQ